MARRIHIIGAGMAGLSTALQLTLAGEQVTLYEAAPFAGGRCRSFYDRDLDCVIDNGNHLVMSGNVAIQDYLELTGALDSMSSPETPSFPFVDLGSGERWTVSMSAGKIPWWLLSPKRRVLGTKIRDYLSALPVMLAGRHTRVHDCVASDTALYRRFWEPLTIGALNTEPAIASAQLLASVLAQSFGAGGAACLPQIPKIGLSETFVDPCLELLKRYGTAIHYNHRLRTMAFNETRVAELEFNNNTVTLGAQDWVVMALPAWVTQKFLPEIPTPIEFRSIISAHFKVDVPAEPLSITGVIGGIAEWVFVKNGIVSVTVSCAERYADTPVRSMVEPLWREVARIFNLGDAPLPPHKIFLEKFATFAATPEQNTRRSSPVTPWDNIVVAGEWTSTGLPTTIESAIRSGVKAAQVVLRWES